MKPGFIQRISLDRELQCPAPPEERAVAGAQAQGDAALLPGGQGQRLGRKHRSYRLRRGERAELQWKRGIAVVM